MFTQQDDRNSENVENLPCFYTKRTSICIRYTIFM